MDSVVMDVVAGVVEVAKRITKLVKSMHGNDHDVH